MQEKHLFYDSGPIKLTIKQLLNSNSLFRQEKILIYGDRINTNKYKNNLTFIKSKYKNNRTKK